MRASPIKWGPAAAHGAGVAKADAASVLLVADGRKPYVPRRGVPAGFTPIERPKPADRKTPRYYPDPTVRPAPPVPCAKCGQVLDAHSPAPPFKHPGGKCDGFQQDPAWRPEPKPDPEPRVFKHSTICPRLDEHTIAAPNFATERARLLDALRPFSGKRTRNCRSKRVAPVVQVQSENNRVRIHGLETCASVWGCPCCAALIYARRAAELQQALERWSGPEPLMMTLTVRHGARDSLRALRKGLMRAWRIFNQGASAQRRRELLDIRYVVRAVEVTWGANGWHPHIHAFLFCGTELDQEERTSAEPEPLELVPVTEAPPKRRPRPARRSIEVSEKAQRAFSAAWRRAVVKAFTPTADQRPGTTAAERMRIGMQYRPTMRRGLDLRPYKEAGGYLAKAGLEVHAITKKGKRTDRETPWDIARRAAAGDRAAVALWQGYLGAMFGARQLTWSRGARVRFGLRSGETDEDALHEEEQAATGTVKTLVAQWSGRSWDRQRRRPGWFGKVTQALHSTTPHLDLAALPGAELRGPPGVVEAAAQPELARAGPRAGPAP